VFVFRSIHHDDSASLFKDSSDAVWNRAFWIATIFLGLLLSWSFGFHFGYSNQNVYFVHGFQLSDPSIFRSDWYVSECVDYHHNFSILVSLLVDLGWGPLPFLFLETTLVIVGVCGIGWLIQGVLVVPKQSLVAMLVWISFAMVGRTSDVMDSYVFGGYLQPSTVGSVGLLWAMAFYVRDRWLWSGAALAIGGLFHINVLLVGIAALALAHLFHGRQAFIERVLMQFTLPLIAVLVFSPVLLKAAGGPATESLRILRDIRTPHHVAVTWQSLAPMLLMLAGGLTLAVVGPRSRGLVRLHRLLFGMAVFLGACTLLNLVIPVDLVFRLAPWRLAPQASVVVELLLAVTFVHVALDAQPRHVAGLLLGLVACTGNASLRGLVLTLLVVLLVIVSRRLQLSGLKPLGFAMVAVVGISTIAVMREVRFAMPSTDGEPDADLYSFIRNQTSVDAVFLVPPSLNEFRLLAKRAVVIDWKSAGMLPNDVVAWYGRLSAVAGRAPQSRRDADRGFKEMTASRIQSLRSSYGADYLLLPKGEYEPFGATVFQNDRWVLFDLRP
jgi:hypothetical protein